MEIYYTWLIESKSILHCVLSHPAGDGFYVTLPCSGDSLAGLNGTAIAHDEIGEGPTKN